ncbi:HemK family methyltransferase [Calycina marina]|uniref:peptide chain release factor N(5)-glutamine methyltransferase n=1 Tax=Calycina marina TaxID=1763456 RepID=A0A9P7Z6Q2_9HELO|nr:HemK family methyltransferase [Calycina marina]
MPRLQHALLLQAYALSPLLPLLLRVTRDLPSALNELRWLRSHVINAIPKQSLHRQHATLVKLCRRRQAAEPLQYILGSQPFGELDIRCRKGVLIPRLETEAYSQHLAEQALESKSWNGLKRKLRVLDLCSGSGCISLLLLHLLRRRMGGVDVVGWDISKQALALSNENVRHSLGPEDRGHVRYEDRDVLASTEKDMHNAEAFDIIICNPPYIHTEDSSVSRSVRKWEPGLALFPASQATGPYQSSEALSVVCAVEDIFYERVLKLATAHDVEKIVLMEVGSKEQAIRVVQLAAMFLPQATLEIWRDAPDQISESYEVASILVDDQNYSVKGSGLFRAVVARCNQHQNPS